ncbi:MFS transporter, partial [Micromonospora sp. NPDC003776]
WLAHAAGAALTPFLLRRLGAAPAAALMRILQGVTVVGMGLLAGPVGVLVAYLACYTVHGASNPLHMGLLHRQVDGPYRTSVLSMNSMVGQPAGALGAVVLTALADRASVSLAMLVGAVVLALGAPLYLPAWRASRAAASAIGEPATPGETAPEAAEEVGSETSFAPTGPDGSLAGPAPVPAPVAAPASGPAAAAGAATRSA